MSHNDVEDLHVEESRGGSSFDGMNYAIASNQHEPLLDTEKSLDPRECYDVVNRDKHTLDELDVDNDGDVLGRNTNNSWWKAATLLLTSVLLSCSLILFNKTILHTFDFPFPILLTTWHLVFASFCTQILARTTSLLDSRRLSPMTTRKYCATILPLAVLFSVSLTFGNAAYLFLTVSFIQMLKASTPVAVLLGTWVFGMKRISMYEFFNVVMVAVGVLISSWGEAYFDFTGVTLQAGAVIFEALRIVLAQKILTPDKSGKMDVLVLLYYYSPACALMNGVVGAIWEFPKITAKRVEHVGLWILFANALLAFTLNVTTALVIQRISGLALTLSGVAKTILLVFLSVTLFGDALTPLQITGLAISSIALAIYQIGQDNMQALFEKFQGACRSSKIG